MKLGSDLKNHIEEDMRTSFIPILYVGINESNVHNIKIYTRENENKTLWSSLQQPSDFMSFISRALGIREEWI